jgi:serine/threonine protein kinase
MAFLFKKKKSDQEDQTGIGDHADPDIQSLRDFLSSKQRVSAFELGATLGTGTFGRVRLAWLTYKGKTKYLALKALKKSEIIRLKQVEHVKSEKELLWKISNPFVVNLYSFFSR